MNKKTLLLYTFVLFFLIVSLAFVSMKRITKPSAPTTPTPTTSSFCQPGSLNATLTLSPGAGNVYGTFMLKNISPSACEIPGSNNIEAVYDQKVKNISVVRTGQTQKQPFILQPNTALYSQVHYPNGPQCNGPAVPTTVTFRLPLSERESVSFTNEQGSTKQVVMTCQTNEVTEITLWNISTTPITP